MYCEDNITTNTTVTISSAQAYKCADFVSSSRQVTGPCLFRQIMTMQKLRLFLSMNTTHFLASYLYIKLEFHFNFCSVLTSFSFLVVDSNCSSASVIVPSADK